MNPAKLLPGSHPGRISVRISANSSKHLSKPIAFPFFAGVCSKRQLEQKREPASCRAPRSRGPAGPALLQTQQPLHGRKNNSGTGTPTGTAREPERRAGRRKKLVCTLYVTAVGWSRCTKKVQPRAHAFLRCPSPGGGRLSAAAAASGGYRGAKVRRRTSSTPEPNPTPLHRSHRLAQHPHPSAPFSPAQLPSGPNNTLPRGAPSPRSPLTLLPAPAAPRSRPYRALRRSSPRRGRAASSAAVAMSAATAEPGGPGRLPAPLRTQLRRGRCAARPGPPQPRLGLTRPRGGQGRAWPASPRNGPALEGGRGLGAGSPANRHPLCRVERVAKHLLRVGAPLEQRAGCRASQGTAAASRDPPFASRPRHAADGTEPRLPARFSSQLPALQLRPSALSQRPLLASPQALCRSRPETLTQIPSLG